MSPTAIQSSSIQHPTNFPDTSSFWSTIAITCKSDNCHTQEWIVQTVVGGREKCFAFLVYCISLLFRLYQRLIANIYKIVPQPFRCQTFRCAKHSISSSDAHISTINFVNEYKWFMLTRTWYELVCKYFASHIEPSNQCRFQHHPCTKKRGIRCWPEYEIDIVTIQGTKSGQNWNILSQLMLFSVLKTRNFRQDGMLKTLIWFLIFALSTVQCIWEDV